MPKLRVAGIERSSGPLGESNVCCIICGEAVTQFPHAAQQGSVRVSFGGKVCEPLKDLPVTVAVDPLACGEPPDRTHHFNVKKMGHQEWRATFDKVTSYPI